MENLFIGSGIVDNMFCGEDQVVAVYVGSTLIWEYPNPE